jgi:hypothetical protein
MVKTLSALDVACALRAARVRGRSSIYRLDP